VEYYPPFLHKLQSLIPQSYGLLSLGHVGHSLTLSYQTQALTLNEQIAVKVEFVQKLGRELDAWATEEGGGKTLVGLMGHSVGAEMAVQTIRGVEQSTAPAELNDAKDNDDTLTLVNTPSTHIDAAFLLFPTLAHIARTPNALRLRPLFHSPLLELAPVLLMLLKPVFLILHLVWYLFPSTRNAQSASIYSPNPITVTMLETPIIVSHVLRLAKSEMETILEPDLDWYARNGQAGNGRVFSYWGANDGWVGKEGDAVKLALEGEQEDSEREEEKDVVARLIECEDNIPHAFCLGKPSVMGE
jgi:hypothetical protein